MGAVRSGEPTGVPSHLNEIIYRLVRSLLRDKSCLARLSKTGTFHRDESVGSGERLRGEHPDDLLPHDEEVNLPRKDRDELHMMSW